MYSKLVEKYIPSPFYGERNAEIDTITIHHMAGNFSIETCGNIFQRKGRNASSNYGIDSDGRIGCYVDEEHRAKTSSNWKNDARAITIEVANDVCGDNWHVSDKAMTSLILLLIDVCSRYKILPLKWELDKAKRKAHFDGANMTIHRDFTATLCPGPYLLSKMEYIANTVTSRCDATDIQTSPVNNGYYLVRVTTNVLNIRSSAGTDYTIKGTVRRGEVYTIVDTQKVGTTLWGKLKSGAGWICLRYTEPVTFK